MTSHCNTDDKTFNLVDDPWILVTMLDGTEQELSLREVCHQLDNIRAISGESPAQAYAVLRIIIIVAWRACLEHVEDVFWDNPSRWWLENLNNPRWLEDLFIDGYLDAWKERFALISSNTPFMQVADLETTNGTRLGIRRLIAEAESDQFTVRAGKALDMLSYPEAARWLIALHAYDYSGIKPGAVGDPRVKGGKGYPIGTGWAGNTGGVVLHGTNLAQTILLNFPPLEDIDPEEDLPSWEREPVTSAAREEEYPDGPADLLTWQSRRVRLINDENAKGITEVIVTNGDRIEIANQFSDHMTAYRWSKNKSTKTNSVFYPRAHAAERTIWKSLEPLLIHSSKAQKPDESDKVPQTVQRLRRFTMDNEFDKTVGVELVGMVYGTQPAVIYNSIHATLAMNLQLLADSDEVTAHTVIYVAQKTVDATVHLGQFSGMLHQAQGKNYSFDAEPTDSILFTLQPEFERWLVKITGSSDFGGVGVVFWGCWCGVLAVL